MKTLSLAVTRSMLHRMNNNYVEICTAFHPRKINSDRDSGMKETRAREKEKEMGENVKKRGKWESKKERERESYV